MENSISILGCGWYGLPLAVQLVRDQYHVKGSTTTFSKLEQLQQHGIAPFMATFHEDELRCDPAFFESKTLLICLPPGRSTGDQGSYPNKIKSVLRAARAGNIENILFTSSTSVYSDHDETVTELDPPSGDTRSAAAMIETEELLKQEDRFKTTIIRFGGLVGPGRDPGRFFAGKTDIPNGQAPINLIHLTDCIGITMAILKQNVFGHTFNAVCPDHPAKQEFYTKASLKSGLQPPAFIDELNRWKKVATNHIPSILIYNYKITAWNGWLNDDKL